MKTNPNLTRVQLINEADDRVQAAELLVERGRLRDAVDLLDQAATLYRWAEISGLARRAFLRLAHLAEVGGDGGRAAVARRQAANLQIYDFKQGENQ